MGFCTEEQCERFLTLVPTVEQEMISRNGIILRKYFLDVSQDEQRRRFEARIKDPVKHWKLSPMDTESVRRWWDYTAAYQRMIKATHTPEAPWYIVPADDKRRARLNLIRHLLDSIPYKKVSIDLPKIPKAQTRPKGATGGLSAGRPDPQSLLEQRRAGSPSLAPEAARVLQAPPVGACSRGLCRPTAPPTAPWGPILAHPTGRRGAETLMSSHGYGRQTVVSVCHRSYNELG